MARAPAYSVVLWEHLAGTGSAPYFESPPVPGGSVWVVRSVEAARPTATLWAVASYLTFLVNGFPVWTTPIGASQNGRVYSAGDVRWVAGAGEVLSFRSFDNGWSVRVSGYQLDAA